MKKLPQRTCIACNQKKDKKELIRIVINKENEIKIDRTGKQNGRGTYICNNMGCLEKALKAKKIQRALKTQSVPEEIFENLKKIINGGEFIG